MQFGTIPSDGPRDAVLVLLAALITIGCALASLKRLTIAVSPTRLDPDVLTEALGGEGAAERFGKVARAVRARGDAEWESAVLDALEHERSMRGALVGEQLSELDFHANRWARVPRACASICTSAAFLLAAIAMRTALADPAAFADGKRGESVRAAVTSAMNVAATGFAGTMFCIAAMRRARKNAKERLIAVERLVDRLEKLAP